MQNQDMGTTHMRTEIYDIKALFRIFLKYKKITILAVLFSIGVGFSYCMLATPMYEAKTLLEIHTRRPTVMGSDALVGSENNVNSRYSDSIKTEFRKMQSIDVVYHAVEMLKKSELIEDEFRQMSRAELASMLEDDTSFVQVDGTHLARLVFRSSSPSFSSHAINAYADAVKVHMQKTTKGLTTSAVEWLQEQVEAAEKTLLSDEASLIAFKQQNNLEGLKNNKTANTQALLAINTDLIKYQTRATVQFEMVKRLIELEQTIDQAGKLPTSTPRYEIIQELLQRYRQSQFELQNLLGKFTEEHPAVQLQQNQVSLLKGDVTNEIGRAIETSKEDLSLYKAYEQSLERTKASTNKEAEAVQDRMNQITTDIVPLERALEASNSKYRGLLRRIEQAKLASDEETSLVNVVEYARVPEYPFSPDKPLVMAISLILGIALGMFMSITLALLENKIASLEDIESVTGAAAIGAIPLIKGKGERSELAKISLQDKFSKMAEAVAGIRAFLMSRKSFADEGSKVLTVIGIAPGDGKTTVSSNLAISFAKTGKNVLLIDGDLRRPKLHTVFDIDTPRLSLMEVLNDRISGRVTFSLLTNPTGVEGLSVIVGAPIAGVSPTEVLETEKFSDFIDWARDDFDIVIIDSPPIGVIHDAYIYGRYSDEVVLVVKQNATTKDSLAYHAKELQRKSCSIAGVVLNHYEIQAGGLGSGDYAYGYGYYGDSS